MKEATKNMFGRKALIIATTTVFGVGLLGSAAVAAFAPASTEATQVAPGLSESAAAKGPKHGAPDRLKAILDALVAKGVITQAQADAILAAIKDAEKDEHKDRGDALRHVFANLFEESAKYLGMTPAELKGKLPGTSLAAIADATAGKNRTGLVATLTKATNDAIAKALADKKITQEQADKAKAEAPDHIAKFVEHVYPKIERKPGALHVQAFLGDAIKVTSDYLKVSVEDIMKTLRTGKSLGEIADSTPGKTKQGLVDAITAAASTKIDMAVQDKKITAEQATQLKAGLAQAVTQLVDRKGTAANAVFTGKEAGRR